MEINGEIVTPEKAKELLADLLGPQWEEEADELRAKAEPFRGVEPMELFIDGQDYQFRRPVDTLGADDQGRAEMRAFRFPTGPVTFEGLRGDYHRMTFFSHSAKSDPPSGSWSGHEDRPYAFTSKKELGDNMHVDLPPFAAVMSPPDCRSSNRHPIDRFFAQPAEKYRVVGLELVDGRALTIVDLIVDDDPELIYLYRAWLDLAREPCPCESTCA